MKRGARINNLLEQLYEMDKELGGKAQLNGAKKKSQEFDDIRDNIIEKLKQIENYQTERDNKSKKYGVDGDNILLSSKVRDLLNEVEREIMQLQSTLIRYIKKPKKFPKQITDNYGIHLQELKNGLRQLKMKEFGEDIGDMEQDAQQFQDFIKKPGNQDVYRYDITEAEQDALNRWNKNDEHMDGQLDQVIEGVDQIKDKALNIGDKLDYTNAQITEIQKQVNKANKELKNQNQQLKELVKTYRRPNKFVLDIMLVLMLIGLIAVAINMFKKGF